MYSDVEVGRSQLARDICMLELCLLQDKRDDVLADVLRDAG